jgi:hypothetical protein
VEKTVSRRYGAAANIKNTSHGQPPEVILQIWNSLTILSKRPPFDEMLHEVSNVAEFRDNFNKYSKYIKGLFWLNDYL